MNAKLDPSLLRATSAEHAVACGVLPSGSHPRLELVYETEVDDTVPCPVGAVSYASMRWERLDREKATIVFASCDAIDRVGVTTYYGGKYVSYRECTPVEAKEAIGNFQRAGFSAPKAFQVKP